MRYSKRSCATWPGTKPPKWPCSTRNGSSVTFSRKPKSRCAGRSSPRPDRCPGISRMDRIGRLDVGDSSDRDRFRRLDPRARRGRAGQDRRRKAHGREPEDGLIGIRHDHGRRAASTGEDGPEGMVASRRAARGGRDHRRDRGASRIPTLYDRRATDLSRAGLRVARASDLEARRHQSRCAMTITDETTNDLKCPVDGCGYEALDDPTKWTKDPSSRLSQHIKRSHPGVDPGAAVAAVMLGEPFEQPEAPPSVDDGPEGPGPYSENGAADAPDTEEVPPTPTDSPGRSATVDEPARRRGPFNRAREVVKGRRKPKSDEQGPATGEKPPKRTRTRSKRISASDLLADLAGWTGRQVQRTGHVPTGRMITWQAPVTGEIIDDVIADTALDRVVVQRLVAARGTLDL